MKLLKNSDPKAVAMKCFEELVRIHRKKAVMEPFQVHQKTAVISVFRIIFDHFTITVS